MTKLFMVIGGLLFVLMFGAATIAVTATLYMLCMEALVCYQTVREFFRKLFKR